MTAGNRHLTAQEGDEPACAWFESTLLLMDGELAPGARAEALRHVAACIVCGPLVRGWSGVAGYMEAGLDDAAERAKPALFQVPGQVLQAITEAPPRRSFFQRLSLRLPVFAGLSSALAAAFLLLPGHTVNRITAPTSVAAAHQPVTSPPAAPPAGDVNDCSMQMLAFDGADGMVYRTETDGMTVIWVHEHEGA